MRDLFPNARNLFVAHRVILFFGAVEIKTSIFSTRPANVLRRARNTKNIKFFQKSTIDAHPISRACVTAKAQVLNLPVANLS
jgi:hypothetical protein